MVGIHICLFFSIQETFTGYFYTQRTGKESTTEPTHPTFSNSEARISIKQLNVFLVPEDDSLQGYSVV
jgi:hypothetical protein